MAYSRESCFALGRRPSNLVFVGLIVYLSRTMDVNHCGPPGTDHPAITSRSVCVVHQRKTRAGSGHRRGPIDCTVPTKQGPVTSNKQEMLQHGSGRRFFSLVLVLVAADIYPRLLCAGRCKNGMEYIVVICGDIEVLRVKGLVARQNRLDQAVQMFREGRSNDLVPVT